MAKQKTTSQTPKSTSEDVSSVIAANTVIELTIPWEKAGPAYQKALTHLATQLKAPGFRQGKVPMAMAEQMLGPSRIIERALNKIVGEYYQAAIEKSGHKPITNPDIKPVSVELNEEWKLEAAFAEEPKITLGNYKDALKKVVKEAEAEHTKHEAEKKKLPKEAQVEEEHTLDDHKIHSIYRALVATVKPAIPEILLRDQTRAELDRLVRSLDQNKISLDTYLQRRGLSFEQLSQEMASVALGQLQLEFILRAVMIAEKIEVTDKDIEAEYAKIAKSDSKAPAKVAPEIEQYLRSILQRQKINAFLLKVA